MTQRRPTTSGVGTVMGDTKDLHVQQTRSLSTAGGVRSLGILMKHAGEAGEPQGAPPSPATPHAPRHLPQPPVPLRNPNKRRKRRRSAVRNKDDPAEIKSLRMIRGTSARPAKPHPQVEAHPVLKREDRLGKEPFAGFGTVVEDITESGYTKNQPILLGFF